MSSRHRRNSVGTSIILKLIFLNAVCTRAVLIDKVTQPLLNTTKAFPIVDLSNTAVGSSN